MYQRFLKALKRIDIVILCLWIIYCGIYVRFPPLKEKLRLILFPASLILLVDFAMIDFFMIYRPIRDHLKEYILRGVLAAIPIIIFILFK